MTLREKQSKFAGMVALLILHAGQIGYDVTLGDAWRNTRYPHPGSHERSLHHKRLAIDLNLFKDGKYLRKTMDYLPLGEYWESIGGSWGGRFSDGNHFSLEHGGMK